MNAYATCDKCLHTMKYQYDMKRNKLLTYGFTKKSEATENSIVSKSETRQIPNNTG